MNLLFFVIALHFAAGALVMFLINRKLDSVEKKRNWLKYFSYLVIFIIVLGSVLADKNVFLGITIIIYSGGLVELLKIGRQTDQNQNGNRILLVSLILFSVIASLFTVFVLLPSNIIICTYILVVVFDGASQLAGKATGKIKILPVLSPDKTVEGAIGGTLSALITSVILHNYAGISILNSLVFGFIVCCAAFIGDMLASAFKRAFGVKNFGNILPGQGGILDRFDSFLMAGAVTGLLSLVSPFSFSNTDLDIAVYLGYSMAFVLVLLTGELIYLIFRIKAEYTRIFSHVFAGFISMLMVFHFESKWYMISICIQSVLFMYLTKRLGLFDSHNKVKRTTLGSPMFFIGILTAYIISIICTGDISVYFLSVLVLTVSDPVACIIGVGRNSGFWPVFLPGNNSPKTIVGSAGFLFSSFVILYAGLTFLHFNSSINLLIISLTTALIAAITEAVSPIGTDNLTIPLIVSVSLTIFAM